LAALQVVVDELLGADGPGFVAARQMLEDVAHAAERLARDSGALLAPGASTEATDVEGQGVAQAAGAGIATGGVSAQIQSRAQALGQLRLVAEYFRRTEPHSPVAYLADKAVQWGNMPLHVWLRTVLKDGGSLAHVEELLGLQSPPPEGPQG
jgi:type VI secretion system protein ImpA